MLRSIDREKCIGCGSCFKACSFDVYRLNTHQEKASPCCAACPAGVDVRSYMHLLQQGLMPMRPTNCCSTTPSSVHQQTSARILRKNLHPQKIDAAVNIAAMEDYLGYWILEHDPALPDITRAGTIAVIGSGAAGLASAYFMRRRGYSVIVYEKEESLGGQSVKPFPLSCLRLR